MIGLTFLAIGLLWLALSVFLAIKLPKWFGASKLAWRGLLGGVIFVILMVGPFVDHIVGMRQFQKLCDDQTGIQMSSSATLSKRGRKDFGNNQSLSGYVINIDLSQITYFNSETNEKIAEYKHFSTSGGRVAGLVMLGGKYSCSARRTEHKDYQTILALEKQLGISSVPTFSHQGIVS